jgi:superfamily II DNA helicase RecQ
LKFFEITVNFNFEENRFDLSSLNEFVSRVEILEIKSNFFIFENRPFYTFLICYKEKEENKNQDFEISSLNEKQVQIMNRLKSWRKQRAEKEGVPPFLIFNNSVLKEIVLKMPDSKSKFLQIKGIGIKTIDKYFDDVYKVIYGE